MKVNEDKVKKLTYVFEWKMKEEHAMGPGGFVRDGENTKSVNGTKSKEKKVSRMSVISKAPERWNKIRLVPRGESAVATTPNLRL